LNLHGAGKAGTAEEGVAVRARLLATRLMHPSSRSD
jgi:hypothetical protein